MLYTQYLHRSSLRRELVSFIPDFAMMPPSKMGWNLKASHDEL